MSEKVGGAGADDSAPGPAPELEPTGDPRLDHLFARLAGDVAELNDHDLTALVRLDAPSTGLHAAARNLELLRRRLAVFDARYVAAVEVGDEPARYAQPSTATFLREQLRLTRSEAKRRVDLAHAITPQVAFTGEVLPAPLPALAAAVTAGVVSTDHARTIIETIAKLPTQVRQESGGVVEQEMATAAAKVTPADLEVLARDVMVRADPDGTLRDIAHADKHRGLRLWKKRGQAGYTLQADLNQETGEAARVVLDAWSKPAPAAEGELDGAPASKDARPHQVRMHDAFGDALRLCDQSALYVLIENSKGVPLYLGRTSRIASPGQTIALAARDRGCSFPGCDRPPSHCQRHHIMDWLHDGPTNIDNLTLVCGYHHREHAKRGWTCQMRDGLPHWRPPAWLDPQRTPIRNTRHFTLPTHQPTDTNKPDASEPGTDTGVATDTGSSTDSAISSNNRDIAVPEGWLPDTS